MTAVKHCRTVWLSKFFEKMQFQIRSFIINQHIKPEGVSLEFWRLRSPHTGDKWNKFFLRRSLDLLACLNFGSWPATPRNNLITREFLK